jgi:hypothetical protein
MQFHPPVHGKEADYSDSNPLAAALSPLGRGEGVGGSAKSRPLCEAAPRNRLRLKLR